MASKRIKGITIEIDGSTTGLDKALSGVNSNLSKTQSSLRDVDRLLKIDPKNTELLSQKQKLLSQAVDETKNKLNSLKTASEQAAKTAGNYDAWKAAYTPVQEEIGKTQDKIKTLKQEMTELEKAGKIDSSEYKALGEELKNEKNHLDELKQKAKDVSDEFGNPISHEQYDALQREIIETEQNLKNLEKQAEQSSSVLGTQMQESGKKISEAGDKITDAGKKLMPLTGGLTAVGTAAVKTAADFDAEMSKVSAISGATGGELEKLREKAREMGEKTKFSATEAGQAMEYMAMAGWKTEDMMNGVEGIMNLAAASGEDLASTSDIVTDALTAFGLSAQDSGHFADILASASSNANTNVSMMGETFKYAAPVLGAMGYSAEDAAVAIGLMGNAGIKSSQAGTALRGAITNLAKPTEQIQNAMDKYGISLTDSSGEMYTFHELMEQLRQKMGGLSEAEQAQAAAAIFGKNAMSGMLAIINGSDADFEKLTDAIANCDGASEDMAATMQDNLSGKITILKSAISEAAISIGEVLIPVIEDIVAKIQEWTEKFNSLDDSQKETIVKIALIAAAIGPLLVVIGTLISTVGTIAGAIGTFISFLGGISGAAGAAGGGIALFSGPLLPVIGIIAGVVAAGVALYKNWDTIKEKATELKDNVKEKFESVKESISNAVTGAKEKASEKLSEMKEAFSTKVTEIKDDWTEKFTNIKNKASETMESTKEKVSGKLSEIKEGFSSKASEIKTGWTEKFTNIRDNATNAMETAGKNVGEKLDNMKRAYDEKGGGIKGIASAAFTGIKDVMNSEMALANRLTGGRLDEIKRSFSNKLEGAKQIVRSAIDRIKEFFNFSWSLPSIKLPHFNITGSFSLNPPQVPSFGIEWYRKGGIMTRPTLFGMNGDSLMAGGESGTGGEAILPLSEFYKRFNQILDSKLASIGERIIELKVELPLYIDGSYSRTEIGEIAMKEISRKQKYSLKGTRVNVRQFT